MDATTPSEATPDPRSPFDLSLALIVATRQGRELGHDAFVGYRAAVYVTLGRKPSDAETIRALRFSAENAALGIAADANARGGSESDAEEVRLAYLQAVETGLANATSALRRTEFREAAREIDLSRLTDEQVVQLDQLMTVIHDVTEKKDQADGR